MKELNYPLRLDVTKPGPLARIYAVRGERCARTLRMVLCSGADALELKDGCLAVLRGELPSGKVIYSDCAFENGVLLHVLTPEETEEAGLVTCTLDVYGENGARLCSPSFQLHLGETAVPDAAVEATETFTALQSAMEDARRFRNAWQNPVLTVTTGETASGTVTVEEDAVRISLTLPAIDRATEKGDRGEPGAPGLTEITAQTDCGLTGILKGDGENVSVAVPGEDYAQPVHAHGALLSDGTVTGATRWQLLETDSEGALIAGRRILCGTTPPADLTGLSEGDIYLYVEEE